MWLLNFYMKMVAKTCEKELTKEELQERSMDMMLKVMNPELYKLRQLKKMNENLSKMAEKLKSKED